MIGYDNLKIREGLAFNRPEQLGKKLPAVAVHFVRWNADRKHWREGHAIARHGFVRHHRTIHSRVRGQHSLVSRVRQSSPMATTVMKTAGPLSTRVAIRYLTSPF